MPIQVFISYAEQDEALRRSLEAHLAALIRTGVIQAWHDRKIVPGANWPAFLYPPEGSRRPPSSQGRVSSS